MTLEEFLENDLPGYEYIDGELVLKTPPARYLPIPTTVTVYRSENDIEILTCEATLTGEEVVPGFTCPVGQLFE